MRDTATGPMPLSETENAELRPEIDREALAEFLARMPADCRGDILAACRCRAEPPALLPADEEASLPAHERRRGAARPVRTTPAPSVDIAFMVLENRELLALWRRVLGHAGRPA
jgi:hypothetical protein